MIVIVKDIIENLWQEKQEEINKEDPFKLYNLQIERIDELDDESSFQSGYKNSNRNDMSLIDSKNNGQTPNLNKKSLKTLEVFKQSLS